MGNKKIMHKHEFVTWVTQSVKKMISESSGCGKKKLLTLLRDNPEQQVIKIYSEIYNWKIQAEDETGLDIERMDSDTDLQISQQIVENLIKTFSAEIDMLED